MMGVFSFLGEIIKPVTKLIDDLNTSDGEKLQMKAEFKRLENVIAEKIIDYEVKLMESRSAIVRAEATGSSWMQRNWRPITMLVFLILVVFDSFGWLENRLAGEAWVLLQIGFGGYVAGRSIEKITPAITKAFGKKR